MQHCMIKGAGIGVLTLASLLATAAYAGMDVSGNLRLQYDNLSASHFNSNIWSGGGSINLPFGTGFNVQGDAAYANANNDIDASAWNFGGEAFWRGAIGDLGASIQHTSISPNGGGSDLTLTSYGAFGDWFAGDRFTVSANGGWFNGSHSVDGNYFGGGLKFYPIPNLSVSGTALRVHISQAGNATNWGLGGEWQVSDTTPLSLYAAYSSTDFSGASSNLNTWTLGVKWRFGEPGTPLVVGDRTSAVPNGNLGVATFVAF